MTITIYPGAGGADAKDWGQMLLKMYCRYAERQNWPWRFLNETTLEINKPEAYERLKNEAGVHRLVRISPFDAKRLRHTSFALVEVLPELAEAKAKEIQIPEKDLKVEFYRSGGPGGQNVNKVETAVRIVHLPTGLTAASQVNRSQAQNRERALKLIKAKLLKLMEDTKIQEINKLRTRVKPEWGNQIRSYVLNPYKLVKDHRTGAETTQVEKVLDGELDLFVGGGIMKSTNNEFVRISE
ncbi:hypothetical protein COY65_03175 [Candidatus Jorgensenbacteria bacterium CG_4_10_14_0_8_um_filter_39_13]|uniref:Prokaryotic-type class I peptide chain release factors domain-containing protein n=2 Tax=Candidatus Joergenseniibacteriota TaxID=1752739 RepID=A0A2M7RFX0_9BACT|nr:MAG: hypothetical protein COV54_00580 [Candidatus Jorgensenbacteria bacterium CG11_big_fil_rev_8_21_14_0_20_38_23]PIV12968.1 MAG: hypothetical protein COS46_02760 [Candidatus Jorgensenbacteria bacterium CG03_land_8_20_14_0_80_38_39]PIW97691.1 MAG: hypothetical protein COZ81_01275 [Candidatus Jorgensenbacteria bacterium CG_4_8_14_3_um_filter_38_10]PIY95487.1 MAG: hypothetical protein COY65_03175 [Candidatus Jorgensenbacteria bacterium CG_4_10_14_0_8_um_filter_39_13]PJA94799.1 MAG: hypothetica